MNKAIRTIVCLLMILLTLTGCEHEQTDDIYIVFTNDVAGEITGNIGYAGVKAYKDNLLKEHPYVTLVDAGDFFDGKLSYNCNGRYIVKLMNMAGYDVVAVGNQEFSIGIDDLAQNIKDSDFRYVSCNLKYLGKGQDPLKDIEPYVIMKYGWTRIAFIGVTTPETLKPGKQAYNAIVKDGELLYDFYGANEGQELYDRVQKTVDKVRKKVDYVIVLSHLGMNSVMKGFSSYELIANTTGIDAVIDAHSHTENAGEAVANKEGVNVVLTSTGEKLQNIGVMEIHPDHTFTTMLYPEVYFWDEELREYAEAVKAGFGQ